MRHTAWNPKARLLAARAAHIAGTCLLAFTLTSCNDEPKAKGEAEISRLPNGALRVVNTGDGAWTEESAWQAVEVVRIGRADGEGADLLQAPLSMETDDAGNLYVLDVLAREVRAFGPDGRHLRSFGRSGAGPGELQQPVSIFRGPEATLWVFDPGNARFTIYDTAGSYQGARARTSSMNFDTWPGRIDDAGRLWDAAAGGEPGSPPVLLWSQVDGDSSGQARLPDFRPEQFTRSDGPTRIAAPVPFAPRLHWTLDAAGRVWAGVSDRYRLVQFRPGGDTLRVVELEVEPVSVTPEERTAGIEELSWFTNQGGRVDAGRIPSRKPAFTDVRVDDRGYLWVTPSVPVDSTGSAFDVFDSEGQYQGRLTLPITLEPWSPIVIRGDRLFTTVLAEEGYPQVVVFRLEGRAAA